MIHSLADHVQRFLHIHNKPPTLSFYDEMLLNKQQKEELTAKEQKRIMDLQRRKEEREVRSTLRNIEVFNYLFTDAFYTFSITYFF